MPPEDTKTDTFRKVYTPLSDIQKSQMAVVKERADDLLATMNDVAPEGERSERSRCVAIARTYLETAVMWAVKGVTTARE